MGMTVVEQPEHPLPLQGEPEPAKPNQSRKRYSSKTFRQRTEPPPEPPPPKKEGRTRSRLECQLICRRRWRNLSVRAGTTLSTKAGDSAFQHRRSHGINGHLLRCRHRQPKLKTTTTGHARCRQREGIEGTVKITIDIDSTGAVVATALVSSLHPEADKACFESWKKANSRPVNKPVKQ